MVNEWPREPFEALTMAFSALTDATPGFSLAPIGRPGSLMCAVTPVHLALFNRVMGVRLADDEVAVAIEGVLSAHAQAGVPGSWWLDPGFTPSSLPDALERHGYVSRGVVPAMAMTLGSLPAIALPPGAELSWVEGQDRMRETQRMVGIGFGMPSELADGLAEHLAGIGDPVDGPARVVVVRVDGVPVASAMAATVNDVAGIYSVVTLPEARGKGLGTTVTLAALHDARERGAQMAVLEASDMGFPIYARMGFRHVGDFRLFASR